MTPQKETASSFAKASEDKTGACTAKREPARSDEQTPARVQDALSELLAALGFEKMSEQVKTEFDHERLCRYARVILKNTPGSFAHRLSLKNKLQMLKLA